MTKKNTLIARHGGYRVLDLDVLRAFIAVVQCGSFTGAAQMLFRTQSALSMQIRRLETQVGCTLVDRRKGGVMPTAEGVSLIEVAKSMLALNDRVFESRDPGVVSGPVRIGAIEHYATSVLPVLIAKFCRRHPAVLVEIQTGIPTQTKAQMAANYDLVVGVSEAGTGDGTVVAKARVVWATSSRHAVHRQAHVPLALYLEGALFGQWATQALDRNGRPWRIAYRSNNVAALKASVASGLAVGVFDEESIAGQLRVLTAREGFPVLPEADIWVSLPDPRASRATTLLHDFLVDALKSRRPRRSKPVPAA